MEELSSQTSADDDRNYNSPDNKSDSEGLSESSVICLLEDSNDEVDSQKLHNETQDTDIHNTGHKVIQNQIGAASYVRKEDNSKNQKPGTVNYTVTEKISALVKANEDTSSHSDSPEIKSRHDPQSILYPRVNCPEKIIICLDLNEEMDSTIFRSRAGDKYTGLELAKRAIKMFVMHKTQMNPNNEFAFLIFHEESTMIHSFTKRAQDMLNTLDESEIESHKSGPLNISHLFETVKKNVELPVVSGDPQVMPPPFIVRVILVFGRSHCVPTVTNTEAQSELESSPYFFTDVLYIHNPPSEENKCEEIFQILCELDHNGMSYIFEQSKYTLILNSGAKLLAHPLQRPRQLEAMYKIGASVPTGAATTSTE